MHVRRFNFLYFLVFSRQASRLERGLAWFGLFIIVRLRHLERRGLDKRLEALRGAVFSSREIGLLASEAEF